MHFRCFVLAFALCVINGQLERALAAEREVFLYGTGQPQSALIHDRGNRWVEVVEGTERYTFEEVEHTNGVLELVDRGRDVGLKVFETHGELRLRNSTEWQPWQTGKWISLKELPKSLPFVPVDQKIRLIYFVPSDRQPIADYERRIRVVMQVVADQFSSEMKAKGYHSDGIQLELNNDKLPIIHLVKSEQTAQYFNGGPTFDQIQHYQRIYESIPGHIGSPSRHMLIAFVETYDPGPAPTEWNGSVGRGGHVTADGGLAIMSSWILRDEFCAKTFDAQKKLFFDKTPIVGRTALDKRQPNSPRFEFIEDGFGAVVHELGHALGLPHDYRQPNDIMGHGFRMLQVNYLPASSGKKRATFSRENARLLGASRYLVSDLDLTDNTLPTAKVKISLTKGKPPLINITMQATDDRGLRAVVFHDIQNDTVIGGAELKGKSKTLQLKLPLLGVKPGEFKIHTMLADDGGNISTIVTTVP